jgi:hypothetical protein
MRTNLRDAYRLGWHAAGQGRVASTKVVYESDLISGTGVS